MATVKIISDKDVNLGDPLKIVDSNTGKQLGVFMITQGTDGHPYLVTKSLETGKVFRLGIDRKTSRNANNKGVMMLIEVLVAKQGWVLDEGWKNANA